MNRITYRSLIFDEGKNVLDEFHPSRKGMANLIAPIPKNDEQAEIVRTLDELLKQEQ